MVEELINPEEGDFIKTFVKFSQSGYLVYAFLILSLLFKHLICYLALIYLAIDPSFNPAENQLPPEVLSHAMSTTFYNLSL